MKKFLTLSLIAAFSLGTVHQAVLAKPATSKKASKKDKAEVGNEQEATPDVTNAVAVDFNCELGDKVTMYQSDADTDHIALRWHQHLHPLTRVGTTTGANRFEDNIHGLVWIGIPSKSILLDSKTGHQLANECKSPQQALNQVSIPGSVTGG